MSSVELQLQAPGPWPCCFKLLHVAGSGQQCRVSAAGISSSPRGGPSSRYKTIKSFPWIPAMADEPLLVAATAVVAVPDSQHETVTADGVAVAVAATPIASPALTPALKLTVAAVGWVERESAVFFQFDVTVGPPAGPAPAPVHQLCYRYSELRKIHSALGDLAPEEFPPRQLMATMFGDADTVTRQTELADYLTALLDSPAGADPTLHAAFAMPSAAAAQLTAAAAARDNLAREMTEAEAELARDAQDLCIGALPARSWTRVAPHSTPLASVAVPINSMLDATRARFRSERAPDASSAGRAEPLAVPVVILLASPPRFAMNTHGRTAKWRVVQQNLTGAPIVSRRDGALDGCLPRRQRRCAWARRAQMVRAVSPHRPPRARTT